MSIERAKKLWAECLTDFVELKKNYRQTEDPEYAESLDHWRRNQPTEKDIQNVNNRFICPKTSKFIHIIFCFFMTN